MPNLEDAIALALNAHQGQYDKGGKPYILHLFRVMLQIKEEEEMIVAVLHDVVEDTAITLEYLREKGYSEKIINTLDHLTRRLDEPYEDYIKRLKLDPLARLVKLHDLRDNLNKDRLSNSTEPREKVLERLRKYEKALFDLTE